MRAGNEKLKGIACTVAGALLYGFTPVLAAQTYQSGSNAFTLTFYRNLLVIPILLALMLIRRIDLRLTLKEAAACVSIGVFCRGAATLMLYASYDLVGTSTATTLHFMYPVFVTLISLFFFRERPGRQRVVALCAAVAGMVLFFEKDGGVNYLGIAISVISGLAYAGYLVGMDKTVLRGMHPFKVSFYMAIAMSAAMLTLDIPLKKIVFALDVKTFLITALIAVCTSFLAVVFIQIGVVSLSAGTASILSLFEPVTCFICGTVFLSEAVTVRKIVGSVLILISAVVVSAAMTAKKGPRTSV